MAEERFHEQQSFPSFVNVFIGGMAAATIGAMAATRSVSADLVKRLLTGTGSLLGITAIFAPMRTTVTEEGVTVTFGLPGWIRFHIAAGEIRGAEAVTYNPLLEFGGWGIRFGRDGTRAYTARGNRGVRIRTDQRAFLVGSQRPEELAEALRGLPPTA